MALKTKRQLLERALEALGALASGQVAEVEDLARVERYLGPTVADLLRRDIYYIADTEEIEEDIFDDLALCLANTARHAFGLGNDPALPASVKGPMGAEASLRIKGGGGPTYKPLRTTYY